jgi:integrase
LPRTKRDLGLDTPSKRARLKVRTAPYWNWIDAASWLGYRKNIRGGSWIARLYDSSAENPRLQERLGHADDEGPADSLGVMSYEQALAKARDWCQEERGEVRGIRPPSSYTVADAMTDYMQEFERRGKHSMSQTLSAINAHIVPPLGAIVVHDLTRDDVRSWLSALVNSPARRRSKRNAKRPAFKPPPKTELEKNRRKDTANRVLTVLKAGLNYAIENQRVSCDGSAWREVKPFHAVSTVRLQFLTKEQQRALVSAAQGGDFRLLVMGALFAGARYGELVRLQVAHFNGTSLYVPANITKTGKARRIMLNAEAEKFFSNLCEGRAGDDPIFTLNGRAWRKSEQQRPMRAACGAAGITPPVPFYALRHTAASNWLSGGQLNMKYIAENLGNSMAICDRFYAHLALDDRAKAFAKMPKLRLEEKVSIVTTQAARVN